MILKRRILTFIYIHLYFLNKHNICGEDEVRSVQVVFVGIWLELIFDSFSVCVCVNIHVLICSVHCQVRVSQAGTQVHLLIEILMMWPCLLLAFPASIILVSKYLVFIRKLVKTRNLNSKDKILNVYIFPFVWNDIECVQVWDVVLVVDTGWGWHHPGVWAVAGKWVAVIWAQFGHHSASAQPRQ